MLYVRFMGRREYDLYMAGETLKNKTRWGALHRSNSVGFCFFDTEDPPEKRMEYLTGVVDMDVVDPPYFSGPERREYYGRKISPIGVQRVVYRKIAKWDVPNAEYFQELFRVSKNQIVWGCNYFDYHFGPGRIVWDKCNGDSVFSDCEIAYCSLHDSVRLFRYMWNGMFQGKSISEGHIQQGNKRLNEKRIHPTQKPKALYDWLFARYAQRGMKILDTHVGSASSLMAAHDAGLQYVGFEKDKYYYDLSKGRLEEYAAQINIYDFLEDKA